MHLKTGEDGEEEENSGNMNKRVGMQAIVPEFRIPTSSWVSPVTSLCLSFLL